jgi:hypothetical protein
MRKMMQMMQGSAKLDEAPPSPARLEINPDHSVMRGLYQIRETNPELAKMVAEQVNTHTHSLSLYTDSLFFSDN